MAAKIDEDWVVTHASISPNSEFRVSSFETDANDQDRKFRTALVDAAMAFPPLGLVSVSSFEFRISLP
jgi:hypothetical protein